MRDSLGSSTRAFMTPLEHAEQLTRIFGEWPSFHDAEVIRLTLDRSGPDGPTLEAQIHVFAMTSEVDATGHYVLKNHTLVTLRFTEVAIERLRWFNNQNVLSDLIFSDLDPAVHDGRRFRVELPSSYGLEGTFECKRAIVSEVKAYDAAA
jgi:Immunity protein 50